MYYYSIGDIHGNLDYLKETIKFVDLESDKKNKLFFLGDYINRGTRECCGFVLYKKISRNV